MVIHTLLHMPFTDAHRMAHVLQRTSAEAAEALETAARCVLNARPIIEPHKDAWVLSPSARETVLGNADAPALKRRGVLWYVAPSADDARRVVQAWLATHDRITSGDFAALSGMSQQGARGALDRLDGDLLVRGEATGRNAHYVNKARA